jgi:hypothetical protein
MKESELQIGLVIYWNRSGNHGISQIVSWDDKSISYRNIEGSFNIIYENENGRVFTSINKNAFLENYSTSCNVYHDGYKYLHCIGKCYPLDKPLPRHTSVSSFPLEYVMKDYELIQEHVGKKVNTPHGQGLVVGADYGRLIVKLDDVKRFEFDPVYEMKEITFEE